MAEPYYRDESVTLYHGDCREVRAWLDADVLVTDPPYGVRWESKHGDNRGPRAGRARTVAAVNGDDDTSSRDTVLEVWGDRPALVFGSWRITRPPRVRSLLIWHKAGAFSGLCNAPFFTNHEEVYVLGDGWPLGDKPLRSVLTTSEHRSQATRDTGHPTPKPVGLMAALLSRCPVGVIADPFAGSGSTLVAARDLGRRAIGVEIDERYCEIAARRLDQGVLDFTEATP